MKLRSPFAVPQEPPARTVLPSFYDRGAALLFDWLAEYAAVKTRDRYTLLAEPLSISKQIWQTNMRSPGMLTPPTGLMVRSLHCFYGRMVEQDRQRLRENYVLQLQIMDKICYESPLIAIPDYGVLMPWALQPLAGTPEPPGSFGEIPRYIGPLMSFQVNLIGKPFNTQVEGSGLRFLPVLNGYMDRSVQ